jgi:two-component system, OmpR family, alkaline phosphatase synthesis response regulator PhoP
MRSIVIIDDEQEILDSLKYLLEKSEYQVSTFLSAEDFFCSTKPEGHSIYLVDWNLPGVKGPDIIKSIRLKDKLSPIFMLSAYNQSKQVVEGLQSGADDYITKPFNIDELLVRVGNAHAKIDSMQDNLINVGLKLIPEAHTIIKDGVTVNLTAREYIIFNHLYVNKDKPNTREEIINQFEKDMEMTIRNIDVHIFALRKKMSKVKIQIETVWGTGYKLSL